MSSTFYYRSQNQPITYDYDEAQQPRDHSNSASSQDVRNVRRSHASAVSSNYSQQHQHHWMPPRFVPPFSHYPPHNYNYYDQQQAQPHFLAPSQQRRPYLASSSTIPQQRYAQAPVASQVFFHSQKQASTTQFRLNGTVPPSIRPTSELSDLRSTLIEQLLQNVYECMICFSKIQRDQPIWSCEICFKLFHLGCIKKWASSEESGDRNNWRCPGCQYKYDKMPAYFCFCRKRANPIFQPGEVPHSCGEVCGKRLNPKSNDCNHFCTELCHPGSCPTCTTMVKRGCLCGRERRTVQCSSNATIKCENVCGKVRSCQNHVCELVCHPRECDPCAELVIQHCSSHSTERQVPCTAETGSKTKYRCGEICGKQLPCGHHTCLKTCHDGPCPSCSRLPDNCTTCACGQTQLDNRERTSCVDPLPLCEKQCNKVLPCGPLDFHHRCSALCHNDACPPCEKETTLKCRCGQESKSMPCQEASQFDAVTNPYLCDQRCTKKRICGKHRCNEFCCDREVHVCELVCGKMLNCNIHKCDELCHKGSCRKCPVNSYDELTCRCGRTVIQPPVACGTQPPACNYPCQRTDHPCDHPVYHSCHNDAECPPCTHLVSKMCVGQHLERANVPCHLKEVLCGQPCGKQLPCGVHSCVRTCHSGPCQAPESKCTQRCSAKRRDCGHPCNAPCHGRDVCPRMICKELTRARCPCGRLSRDIVCNVRPSDENISEDNSLAQSLTQALSVRTLDLSTARKQQLESGPPQLECDDECRVAARNRNLAQALSINVEEHRNTQAQTQFTDWMRDYARKNLEFVQQVERQLTTLVEETQRHRAAKRCYSFKPMKTNERRLIHELAPFYGLETQALDPEPMRNVVAYSTLNTCKLPPLTLSDSVRRERGVGKVPPPVSLSF